MAAKQDLYNSIVGVTEDYLGPAARRFIDRQIQNHLEKSPEELTKHDMPTLVDWVRVSFAFLTDDRQLIDELTKRLRSLAV
jgi:hypothetical protein